MRYIVEKDENISMACGVGATVTLFTVRVPQGSKMRITHFGNYLNLAGHWSHVTWSMARNGVGVHPYDVVLDQLGLESRAREVKPPVFNGGDEICITATDDGTIAQPPALAVGILLKYQFEEK